MELKIGTRGSRLALAQTRWVARRLEEARPGLVCREAVIRTTGDKILDKPLAEIGSKGLFVAQIEEALLEGKIDLAVHSMKDLPAQPTPGLCFCRTLPRADRRDVLVLRQGLSQLPRRPRLATGSARRARQLAGLWPGCEVVGIRGNLDTRLAKLDDGQADGLILAAAGLARLGLEGRVSRYLTEEELLPAPAQGALAVQLRRKDEELLALLDSLSEEDTHREVLAERAFLAGVGGGCHLPAGASAHIQGDTLTLSALLGRAEGGPLCRLTLTGPARDPEALGRQAACRLLARLAKED